MAAAGEGLRARLVPRCIKCRERDAAALVNQTEALCALCLRGALLGKFKSAVNGGKLIAKDDHVLLAFSGGAASRCALDFLLAIQSPFLDSQGAAPLGAQGAAARGRIPFRLSVGHVDESVAVGNDLLPRGTADRLAGEMREVVRDAVATHREARAAGAGVGAGGGGGGDSGGGERLAAQLAAAVAGAADGTGREDLVEAMRMDALHLLAYRVGCSKIVVGTTVTRMAARVIAATAKAQGFSLPTDLACLTAAAPCPCCGPSGTAASATSPCSRTCCASKPCRCGVMGEVGDGREGGGRGGRRERRMGRKRRREGEGEQRKGGREKGRGAGS
ncbi:hypothetical protein CLOM_g17539 [Closterium sp. NIES-68]|nr:hypothetical protein CLOM_g17539 [Closterium sp. NIES-68]